MHIDDNDETYSDPDLRCSLNDKEEENKYCKTEAKYTNYDAKTQYTSANKPQISPDPRRHSGFSLTTVNTGAKSLFNFDGLTSDNRSNTKHKKVPLFKINDVIKKEQSTKAKTKRTRAELQQAQDKISAQLDLNVEPINNRLYNNLKQCEEANRIKKSRYQRRCREENNQESGENDLMTLSQVMSMEQQEINPLNENVEPERIMDLF